MRKRMLMLGLIGAVVASGALVGATAGQATVSTTEVHVWIGLKNSDDVGTSFDLKAQVCQGACGTGETDDVWGGSSGFNNAHPVTIPIWNYIGTPGGGTISVTVWARVSCSSRHLSGTARLWYNDAQANSNVEDEYGFGTRYLVYPNALSPTVGPGPKKTSDVFVKKSGCPEQPAGNWQSFGTWSGAGGGST